jgi:hypothetical protein
MSWFKSHDLYIFPYLHNSTAEILLWENDRWAITCLRDIIVIYRRYKHYTKWIKYEDGKFKSEFESLVEIEELEEFVPIYVRKKVYYYWKTRRLL